MKFILIILLTTSCSAIPMKNSGKIAANGLPECSWDRPFDRCESSQDAKPLWNACPEGYQDLANGLPSVGIHCAPIIQPITVVKTISVD